MPSKNHSQFVKCPIKRQLTAKGYKFLSRCVEIAAENKGLTRYHKEFRPFKDQLNKLIHHLFIDKGMNQDQIIEAIKNRIVNKSIN